VRAEAFEALFELHFDVVYGYLARRVGADIGRDLASETFLRAFAARKRYDAARGEVRPWLFGIANNLLHRHHRDEERRLRAFARLDARQEDLPPGEPRLAQALVALPREERDALLLFRVGRPGVCGDRRRAGGSRRNGPLSPASRTGARSRRAGTRGGARWMSSRC
jgi:RNA polymerase sigma factor (sigma-70 family)